MKQKPSISFFGGDLRQVRVTESLKNAGYGVSAFGMERIPASESSSLRSAASCTDCLQEADAVVFPLPYLGMDKTLYAPFAESPILWEQILSSMEPDQLLLAGRADDALRFSAASRGIRLIDYADREDFLIRNAVPTVEGALAIALNETSRTIHQSRCLVLGYGRIGRLLSASLRDLGAYVTVCARKPADLAEISANRLTGLPFSLRHKNIKACDIIFNTVPAQVLTEDILADVRSDCLILDLASRPGGVDFEAAKNLGKRAIRALSLPGKIAPDTAGDIIKDTLIQILEEQEV